MPTFSNTFSPVNASWFSLLFLFSVVVVVVVVTARMRTVTVPRTSPPERAVTVCSPGLALAGTLKLAANAPVSSAVVVATTTGSLAKVIVTVAPGSAPPPDTVTGCPGTTLESLMVSGPGAGG